MALGALLNDLGALLNDLGAVTIKTVLFGMI
jgi:hypothetical protein